MWLLAIINALGLIIGTFTNETMLYIFAGISFVAFSTNMHRSHGS